ncbi:carboxynorspermidine decarboxylase [uncultured Sphaerochaeta sp.]|uniref:carboxynorspermidine decarboxylase n=1 Tax=uncultured Sphaerochaeta sp. TaxID=886478 RepID=UPI002A0A5066|nr:carboxynorspermidine decarboxylase [uncultured Sphaerochaeta sp.]
MLDVGKVLHTPAFVLEYEAFAHNLEVIAKLQEELPCTFLLALKGFGMHAVFPELAHCAKGATASSLNEALLASEYFKEVHAYAPVYQSGEFSSFVKLASHVTFNSLEEYHRYENQLGGALAGLRINPEYSLVETELYNPCSPGSRLGIPSSLLQTLPEGISGLHAHNLCESGADAMSETLKQIEKLYGHLFSKLSWLNLGGGHLVTRKGYDLSLFRKTVLDFHHTYPHIKLFFEPGAAYVWETGVLVSTVLDMVTNNGITTAMLDTSFAAHMPDCLEMPYTPRLRGASIYSGGEIPAGKQRLRLGGASCLAGDWVGEYLLPDTLKVGDRLVFEDMMHYTMVKTTMFNGLNLPDIAIYRNEKYEVIKHFSYSDYRNRLS